MFKKIITKYKLNPSFGLLVLLLSLASVASAQSDSLIYQIDDFQDENLSNIDFSNTITREIKYNPETGEYDIITKIGDVVINSTSMDSESYQDYAQENDIDEYWKERVDYEMNQGRAVQEPDLSMYLDTTDIPNFIVNPVGNVDLILGFRSQNVENPTLPVRQRKTGALDLDMNIQMQIDGSILDRLNFDASYNTESNNLFTRDLFNVGYMGKEDDILQELEFGNVALPLRGSLIRGNQSLLGVKSTLQFGRLRTTSIISQQQSRQQGLQLQGGAQRRQFEIRADEYEENRHFFLAHYFRDQYNDNFATLPQLNTPYNITRLQVWVTNQVFQTTNVREFAAFTDLGELNPGVIFNNNVNVNNMENFASNDANDLYAQVTANGTIRQSQNANGFLNGEGFFEGTDYEMITARKLEESEYEFNRDLGYISLNRALAPEEVIAVAFEYTDLQGEVHRVGEFSEDLGLSNTASNQDQVLVLKLLKPRAPRTDLPTWDLMMKNIYSLGAFQIDREEFRLDVYYNDPGEGLKRYLPIDDVNDTDVYEQPMIQVLRLDQFNQSQIQTPDGVFDWLPNFTIDPVRGRLIFPVVEPFGDHLRSLIDDVNIADSLAYDELYDLTQAQAELFPEFNRFNLVGSYQSASRDEISLGAFNIPQGSVIVRSGGRQLVENIDYTIDYNLGRIKILNTALVNAGVPLDVQFENNLQLGFQSKRLMGTRLDYFVNNKLSVGATAMNMRERPFTNKVNLGDDPVSNTVLGADLVYESKSGWLTRAVDKIPFINTKEESSISLQAEYARFMPGNARQIDQGGRGQVFIDDFEGSSAVYDLRFPIASWTISSTPARFPEAALNNDLQQNSNRAQIAWYNIDPLLNSNTQATGRPDAIGVDEQSDIYARQVRELEVFPNVVNQQRVNLPLATFDVSYFPEQRGPYNFDTNGLLANGNLANPRDRWGGIMRNVTVTDFQAANVEFVEFWLMDPFVNTQYRPNNSQNSGKLILNLGNISEDILKDGRMSFENGLPEPGQQVALDQTNLGVVPTVLNINNAFAASEEGLIAQDVGYDGLNNEAELAFFSDYIQSIQAQFGTGSIAYQNAIEDPSADDFQHFLGEEYDAIDADIVTRYSSFSNPHGNTSSSLDEDTNSALSFNSTNTPDSEDINRDNTLERSEAYFEYELDLSPGSLQVGQNFIVSQVETNVELANGTTQQVNWYQFKVPVTGFTNTVNTPAFQSIRFIRMYLTDFEQPTTFRFARLNLLRNEWRRYEYDLDDRTQLVDPSVQMNVFPISIEEDQQKQPFPYVLPPGIQREELQGAANSFLRDEQSLAMNICALPNDDERAIYKLVNLDIRQYENLEMFVHAEQLIDQPQLITDEDFELFIRIGSDFTQNYYEYTQPLLITPNGAADAFSIWPKGNNVNISLKEWVDLKNQRSNAGASATQPFSQDIADGKSISVLGVPDLGRADFVMIGVRHISGSRPKCVEVWVNELRLSGLNEDVAQAALARADIQLADFGNVTLAGNMHTAGYGSIEQRVDERFRDDFLQYDLAGNFNLDKFLPAKSTVKIPVFASHSKTTSQPQFNPYETDVELRDAPSEIRDALKDQTSITTLSVTNLRKERKPNTERKPKIYDVENLNASFSYTQQKMQNAIVAEDLDRTYYGALGYNYRPEPKPIRPFFNLIKEQKYLQWLKEFNINPVPSNLAFRTDMTSRSQLTTLRDIQQPTERLDTFYFRDWIWNRNYDLTWDLTNSINIRFQASNQSRIDTPDGEINTQEERDSIWSNIRNFGRNVLYNHNMNAGYQVPFNKIPILDFINADIGYNADYNWLSAPLEINQNTGQAELGSLGNAIRNSQGITVNATLDMNTLYNKSGFLRQINGENDTRTRPGGRSSRQRPGTGSNEENEEENTENSSFSFLKPLLAIKRVSLNYSQQRGTFVPGFTPTPEYLGLNAGAPGLGFVFGEQVNRDWLNQAAANDWLTKDTTFSYQFLQDRTRTFNVRANLQPIRDMTIDLNLDYSKTDNYSELFRNNGTVANPSFESFNPYESGAYNISFISFRTLFQKPEADGIPQVFRDFEANRREISQLLAARNPASDPDEVHPDDPEFAQGYGPYSQEVIMGAFISAYTGRGVGDVELNPFNTIPLPNWNLTYSGLTNIPFFEKNFRTIRLNHVYTSSFQINQYNTNLAAEAPENYFLPTVIDTLSDNFQAAFYIPQAIITESFAPLIGIDVNMNNGFQAGIKYNKTRTLGLSLLDYQLSENNSTGFTGRLAYQTKNFKLPFNPFGKRVLENDLIFQMNFDYRDDIVTNYKLDQNTSLPTQGAETISIQPTIDYVINNQINIQLYLDRRRSVPKTRSSFPVGNTRGGIRMSYTFLGNRR